MKEYKEGIYAWHEEYAARQGYTMTALFEMTNVSWKKYSLWNESSITAGEYHRVSPDIAYMKRLPMKDLLLEVQRENPH